MKPLSKEYSKSRQLEIRRPDFVNQDLLVYIGHELHTLAGRARLVAKWMDGTGHM